MGSIERRSLQDRRQLETGLQRDLASVRAFASGRHAQEEEPDYLGGRDHRRATHVLVIQERPTNIPGRLWGDL